MAAASLRRSSAGRAGEGRSEDAAGSGVGPMAASLRRAAAARVGE